jgi:hypothetical protein
VGLVSLGELLDDSTGFGLPQKTIGCNRNISRRNQWHLLSGLCMELAMFTDSYVNPEKGFNFTIRVSDCVYMDKRMAETR